MLAGLIQVAVILPFKVCSVDFIRSDVESRCQYLDVPTSSEQKFIHAMAILSAIGLALGVLRHYLDIYIHRTVRGISWLFVILDALGDLTSLLAIGESSLILANIKADADNTNSPRLAFGCLCDCHIRNRASLVDRHHALRSPLQSTVLHPKQTRACPSTRSTGYRF